MDIQYIIDDICRSLTPGLIFWSIILGILANYGTRLLDHLLNPNRIKKAVEKRGNLEMTLDVIGGILLFSSFIFFILIYVFDLKSFLLVPIIGQFMTIPWLVKAFLVGYFIIIFIHAINSIRRIIASELTVKTFIFNLSILVFFSSIIVLLAIYFKMTSESIRGFSTDQLETSNSFFRDYALMPLIKSVIISGILISSNYLIDGLKSILGAK